MSENQSAFVLHTKASQVTRRAGFAANVSKLAFEIQAKVLYARPPFIFSLTSPPPTCIIAAKGEIMTRMQMILVSAITLLATSSAHAQRGRCGYDNGNACLNACGTMQQNQFDNGVYSAGGNYSMSYIHVDCSSADLVCGWSGDGINYSQQNGSCPSGVAKLSPEDWRFLERVSHGHPVFTASCAGGLYPAPVEGYGDIADGAKKGDFKFPVQPLLLSHPISRTGD